MVQFKRVILTLFILIFLINCRILGYELLPQSDREPPVIKTLPPPTATVSADEVTNEDALSSPTEGAQFEHDADTSTPASSSEHDASTAEHDGEQVTTEHDGAVSDTPTPIQIEHTVTNNLEDTEEIRSATEGGEYYIAVTRGAEEIEADLQAGKKRVIVTASLGNQEGSLVVVNRDSLALIDQDGNSYQPEPPDPKIQPALVGTELGKTENVYGFATFEIPIETTELILEWCLNQPHPCEQPLQARIP